MSNIREVLFDCDGTLVDSEVLAMRVAGEILRDHVHLTRPDAEISVDAIVQEFAGWHFDKMIGEIANRYDVPIDEKAAIGEKVGRTLEALSQVAIIPGLQDILDKVLPARNLDFSLVTSSEFQRVDLCLEVTGLDNYFPQGRKFSAHDTLSPPDHKPSPAIYLHALEVRGLQPEEAVAVEDSKSGVESARRAGIKVIGFVGATHIPEDKKDEAAQILLDKGAAMVISDMNDLGIAIEMLEGNYKNALNVKGLLYLPPRDTDEPQQDLRFAP